ncbi:hypothetical protein DRN87_00185 [Candidatus Geothermarchaeota archaeon]|nr:MAG: hypothetical protein DRN87_00185 [Candidatus Geothermarchaeota archaeon]HEW93556.1 hypothetical protein [Thermoprotei archaeon]
MTTIIESLENDHIAIRLFNRCFGTEMDLESFKSFHEFIVEVHAKIEDEILIPAILEAYRDQEDVKYLAKRISADHLLIAKLGESIIEYGEKGNLTLYKKRLDRYMKILIDHNRSEENLLFPLWKNVPDSVRLDSNKKALEIINKYGYGKFTRILRNLGKNI